jgi:hypothetical protein
VLTEQVFTIPGFGKMIVDSVFNRDYAVVQGVVLIVAIGFLMLTCWPTCSTSLSTRKCEVNHGGTDDANRCACAAARAEPGAEEIPRQ